MATFFQNVLKHPFRFYFKAGSIGFGFTFASNFATGLVKPEESLISVYEYPRSFTFAAFTKSIQVGGTLSNELREKLGKRKVRVAKGDSVKVLRGEYKGIEGKVTKVSTEKTGVAIEGIKKEKLKGEKIDIYIDSSNIQITGLNTDDNWRKFRLEGKNPKITPKEQKITEPKENKNENKIIKDIARSGKDVYRITAWKGRSRR